MVTTFSAIISLIFTSVAPLCFVGPNCLILLVTHDCFFGRERMPNHTKPNQKVNFWVHVVQGQQNVWWLMNDIKLVTLLEKTETRWSIKKWFKDHVVFSHLLQALLNHLPLDKVKSSSPFLTYPQQKSYEITLGFNIGFWDNNVW